MRGLWLIAFLLGFSPLLFGQMATLTSGVDEPEPTQAFIHYQWRIRNHTMGWGDTLKLSCTQSGWDTLFFRENPQQEWLPMLCQIKSEGVYTFLYNPCCGGFYLRNDQEKYFPTVKAKFIVEGKVRGKEYAGIYGGAAYLLSTEHAVWAQTHCLSVMQSNVMGIKIGEWETATAENQPDWICLFDSEGNDWEGDAAHARYKILSETNIAPFESGTVLVRFNPRRKTVKYEWMP